MHNTPQSRFVRQPAAYSADKSKSRFAVRSRLRNLLRRVCCLDLFATNATNSGPSHLRASSKSSLAWMIGLIVIVVIALSFVLRPFQTSHTSISSHFHSVDASDQSMGQALNESHSNVVSLVHKDGNSKKDEEANADDDDAADGGKDDDDGNGAKDDDDGNKAETDGKADTDGDAATKGDDDTKGEDKGNDDADGKDEDAANGGAAGDDDTANAAPGTADQNDAGDKSDNKVDEEVVAKDSKTEEKTQSELSVGTHSDHSDEKPMHESMGEQHALKLAAQPDPVRDMHASKRMSAVILFHNEYESLNTALGSWVRHKLVDFVDEMLFFLNGVQSSATFRKMVPDYEAKIPLGKRRIVLSRENLPLGLAITRMVELAKNELVLLLEKDWELIENEQVMRSRLLDSKVFIGSGLAHVVRHRHRHNPGVPLHALIMHQGREESIFRQQPNLLCFSHHWVKDPSTTFPGVGHMWRCGGKNNHMEEEDVFCATSEYCCWVNNPAVFGKKWFMDEVGDRYRKEYAIEKGKYGISSPFLDFEYYTNWRRYAWTDKNFTVAVGAGLFKHSETEHQHFNTFWYAHYRLQTDLEEIRNFYLKNETKFKKMGGVHVDSPAPLPMMERYPVEFVRKFQWAPTFTGTLQQQVAAVDSVYAPYLKNYRVSAAEWDGKGEPPAKATKAVPWRAIITEIHQQVEKAMMLVPPIQPHEMSITLVTALLDIGRHGLAEDAYQFRRDFKMYLDAMQDWLKHKYPKVVYTSQRIKDELLLTASQQVKDSTHFVITTNEELSTKWLGPDNYAKVQELRLSEKWRARAGWLPNSPQAGLEYYNPLVMSKMFIVRDAARTNPWKTTHFLFVDAKHNCRKPEIMTPKNDHILRAHMFEKFLLTTFDYTPADEVHGFAYEQFNAWCNMENPQKRQNVRVGRGGIFGGNAFVMEYMTAAYDVALTASLREGLMGTEENIMSIIMYNLRQYVDEFSNNWACPDVVEKDHMCKHIVHQGYNCAIFDWVARDAVPWQAEEK